MCVSFSGRDKQGAASRDLNSEINSALFTLSVQISALMSSGAAIRRWIKTAPTASFQSSILLLPQQLQRKMPFFLTFWVSESDGNAVPEAAG